jgi:hypothetical protein
LRRITAQPTLAAMKTDVIDLALASPSAPSLPDPKAPIPRQIRYIIGNEGCDRIKRYAVVAGHRQRVRLPE